MSVGAFSTPVNNLKRKSKTSLNGSLSASPMISIPPSPFLKKLGWGTGVSVYLYERSPKNDGSPRSPWAVKKLLKRTVVPAETVKERLKYEADILKRVNHPNVVGYRGYIKDKNGVPCLIMENGEISLYDLIEARIENNQGSFPAKQVHKVAVSVLNALRCLHTQHKLLHGDLKSANVLVANNFESIKLCDFGVSLKLKDDLTGLEDPIDRYIGTAAWNCKESFENGPITDKADMYSFGLVLWEMITLLVPHTSNMDLDCTISDDDDSFDGEDLQSLFGTQPPLPDTFEPEYQPLLELIAMCTSEDPDVRPSASTALQALQSLQFSS
ncbi:lymphokine-activated killer T-cell-originated protein kinase-like [Antedon mediterranea]|uniref:lymphokine-activated killer T-cell-originated protein kinase-like n=1 Tax=Antedon mediterranea TaxID=105859 RepID=UPI003AF925BC